ncbi:unnamed protein product [Plutella xylostella]|uniref:(diamondback moth) hypothetical protein n=1 Tax=Plutella xylostella TaxID=51655 RepID=A0A8S4GC05_PLUXY|nr:unnamed protein product [Plutella xylostella]
MMQQGVLRVVAPSPSFISTIFLRPKSDGTSRPIFNLKSLNKFVMVQKFRLINIHRVPDFLQSQDWMAKIDFHQAYFHLKVARGHRRFLRLIYKKKLMEMTCLPFRLSSAPKTFASISNWIAQRLREEDVRILVYLDDFYLVHQNRDILLDHVTKTVRLLENLGWNINKQKSILKPQKALEFLGIIWDSWNNIKYLPERIVGKIQNQLHAIINKGQASVLELQQVVGIMNFASFVIPRGRLNYRATQKQVNTLLKLQIIKSRPLPKNVLVEMKWWVQNCRKTSQIHVSLPMHYLTTDASDIGWGAKLDHESLEGTWTLSEQSLHCNQKEMIAILNVLRGHGRHLSSKALLIQCDNQAVVSYLRNEGGTKSTQLMNLTMKVFHLIDHYNIQMSIYHIPGNYNQNADHLSRHKAPPEWHLLPQLTQVIFQKWGTPSVDLFASQTAHVVENYCSLDRSDQQAYFHDALSRMWDYPLAWVFPPPYLIPKVLGHLNTAKGLYLIVVPRWDKVFWRPDLKSRATAARFTVRNLSHVLVDVTTGLPPPKVSEMTLEIWKCGGGTNT